MQAISQAKPSNASNIEVQRTPKFDIPPFMMRARKLALFAQQHMIINKDPAYKTMSD